MSTKNTANKTLNQLYRGTEDRVHSEHVSRNGDYRVGGIVTPKPGGIPHLQQLQNEAQARHALDAKALEQAHQRRQAIEALDQLQGDKQQQWLQAGGTVEEFRQAWPEMRRQYLQAKVARE